MLDINNMLPEELKWIPSLKKSEEMLAEYEASGLDKDIVYSTINNYNKFLNMIFEYGNLRCDFEYMVPVKRLIRIKRSISSKELDFLKINHVIMEGMCVESTVVFINSTIYDEFMVNPNSHNKIVFGLDDYRMDIAKKVRMPNGIDVAVTIVNGDKAGTYARYYSEWEYVVF